ncbi:MAG: mandelate racemase/muconate lactonizing enzyme family protein [bacterium]|nr:mandelate racemase/muconate lactonizing enzyme family protein [bacterium]
MTGVNTIHCAAGWRVWTFVKITTDEGLVGYSECTDSNGSPRAIAGVVKDLEGLLIGKDPRAVEKLYWELYSATRQSPGSVIQKAIAGIENALLDIKGKALGVPVYELFGGPIRRQLPVYWSHCGTSRVRAAHFVGQPPIQSLDDVEAFAREVVRRGFRALKTNPAVFAAAPTVYMPAFGKSAGGPELNITRELLDAVAAHIAAFRRGAGDAVEIMLDLNFNFKTEGYIRLARHLEPFDLAWLEIDSYDPRALRDIRERANVPVCSGENLYGLRGYRPYFEAHAMDIASIDIAWNGFAQSKKIADMAELYEMNVAPHNHHSHFGTFMSAQFAAAIPNFRILEVDIDDVPWKNEITTATPVISNGVMTVPAGPGWGIELNEAALERHQWNP